MENLPLFRSIRLKRTSLKPHSRLNHLEPVGVGTREVESLTGYIIRLAVSHNVQPGRLIAEELAPLCNKKFVLVQGQPYISQIFCSAAAAINGAGQMAQDWVEILEALTLRQELRFLTMLSWRHVLQNHLAHPMRAWCPACYGEDRAAGKANYERLIWTLNVVTACLTHGRRLETRCGFCGKQHTMLARRARPGYCSNCDEWLGVHPAVAVEEDEKLGGEELSWQTAITDQVGALFVASTRLSALPQQEGMAAALSACMDRLGSMSDFARRFNWNSAAVYSWRDRQVLPRLKTLLRFCHCAGVSAEDILRGDLKISRSQPTDVTHSKRCRRDLSANNLVELKLQLQDALTEDPAPSMSEMTRRTGRDRGILKRYFPELCRKISDRYKNYTDRSAERGKVRLLLLSYSKESPPPSLARCAKRVGYLEAALRIYFPELSRLIAERHRKFKKDACEKSRERCRKAVREIIFALHSAASYPSRERITERLGRSPYNIKISNRELDEVIKELRQQGVLP
jgi:hypothetical protein